MSSNRKEHTETVNSVMEYSVAGADTTLPSSGYIRPRLIKSTTIE